MAKNYDSKAHNRERERERERANNEELTIEQLEEKLRRKQLEEKLKEKHKDSSILGVCQTCHVPIYHGEAIYTPRDYATEGSWHAEGGGVVSGSGGVELVLVVSKAEIKGIRLMKIGSSVVFAFKNTIRNYKKLRTEKNLK